MQSPSKFAVLAVLAGVAAVGGISTSVHGLDFLRLAQNAPAPAAQQPAKPAPKARPVEKPKAAPAPVPAAGAAPTPAAEIIVSQKLIEAGAGCTERTEAMARDSMSGTKSFVPVSTWLPQEPRKHMAAVVIGQNFGQGSKVPHGLTGIVTAPGPTSERCEGYAFQVMPSPLSCADIQSNFLKGGQFVADLAGFPLLRDAKSQVALIPAAGSPGCVVVSFRSEY